MANTICHNRARGTHDVDLMILLIKELHELGRSEAWISKHLGMDRDEILRLKQITGLVCPGIMRAEGDVFYSTIQWCCPVIINLLLDPLFIYGFQMGISGAAIATLIAQLFSAGISIYYFFVRKKSPVG